LGVTTMAKTAAERQRARRQRLREAQAAEFEAFPLDGRFLWEFRGWPIRRRQPSGAWARDLARTYYLTEQAVRRRRHEALNRMAVEVFGNEVRAACLGGQPPQGQRKPEQSIADYLAAEWPTMRYREILWRRIADVWAERGAWFARRAANAGAKALDAALWLEAAGEYLTEATGQQLIDALEREGAELFVRWKGEQTVAWRTR
jgi:hypothetical protein